jgi:NAD(P)H-hydrate epimerase
VIAITTPDEMGAIDADAPEPVEVLIGRAGWAVARVALDMLGGSYGRVVNLVAGPGNNGADGRVGCEQLARRGVLVRRFDVPDVPDLLPAADLVIDAAFGTGFRGSWDAPDPGGTPVLAVDIPSGVEGLTGRAPGRVMAAARTVTFQALKPGLLLGDGAALAGDVAIADIGLDAGRAQAHLVEAGDVAAWLPGRARDSHKWRHAVRVVAGSPGMSGAAALCTAAAGRAGAGLIHLVTSGDDSSVRDEVLRRRVEPSEVAAASLHDLHRFAAVVVGPGVGRSRETVEAVRQIVGSPVPMVIDGDGLMALEIGPDGEPTDAVTIAALVAREHPTVLTPHDAEFSRLVGCPVDADRFAATRALASRTGCVVLLKGPTTVVSDPLGDVLVVDHGDERLATAGSGDVLAGVIGSLLACGVEGSRAAAAGAWIHSEAGRRGPAAGLLAGDLVDRLPDVMADLG